MPNERDKTSEARLRQISYIIRSTVLVLIVWSVAGAVFFQLASPGPHGVLWRLVGILFFDCFACGVMGAFMMMTGLVFYSFKAIRINALECAAAGAALGVVSGISGLVAMSVARLWLL